MRELKKLEIVTSLATRYTFAHMKRAYRTKLDFGLAAKDIYSKKTGDTATLKCEVNGSADRSIFYVIPSKKFHLTTIMQTFCSSLKTLQVYKAHSLHK